MLHREIVGLPTSIYPVEEWALVETDFAEDYLGRAETIFSTSNGYLGLRGCVDEGRPFFDRGTYINGFHETWPIQHAEEAFGFAKVGQTIVPVPDARRFHLYVDDEVFHLDTADLEHFERRLDFRTGVLERVVVWRTPRGSLVRIASQRVVSMHVRHLVAFRYEITMLEGDGSVVISSQLRHEVRGGIGTHDHFDPRQSRDLGDVLRPKGQAARGTRSILEYRVAESDMSLACAIDHVLDVPVEHSWETEAGPERSKTVVSFRAEAGTTIRIDKFATYFTSRAVSTEQLSDRCQRTLDRVIDEGFDKVVTEQRAWFDDFWSRADVVVDGNPVVQQAVRWNVFQLAQAAGRVEGTGIPAKGLTGSGYEGHYFWDTEIYVLPFLIYTLPRAARNLLLFRHSMLDAARRRATEVNQRGALFPWRTINGEEASAYYEAGTAQYHINADIVYALKKYIEVTGDGPFLHRHGAELLVETARLWADLGHYDSAGVFHIFGVTGPDEYTTLVNDNAYTNLMARMNLRYAAEVITHVADHDLRAYDLLCHSTSVTRAEILQWQQAAEAMYIPYDETWEITPQDDNFLEKAVWDFDNTPNDKYPLLLNFHPLVIYRYQVLKQADIVLAMFLLSDEFGPELKHRNFEYYDPLTTGDSSLSSAIQSIVAAELDDDRRAIEYFRNGLFMDLADVAGNAADGVHVAAAGGVWLTMVYGFGGMRDVNGKLSFRPSLPSSWEGLSFAVTHHGVRLRVTIRRFDVTYLHEAGEGPITFEHRGESIRLDPGIDCSIDMRTTVPGA